MSLFKYKYYVAILVVLLCIIEICFIPYYLLLLTIFKKMIPCYKNVPASKVAKMFRIIIRQEFDLEENIRLIFK